MPKKKTEFDPIPEAEMARHYRELVDTPGWRLLKQMLQTQYMAMAGSLTKPGRKTDDEFHFLRGQMWALEHLTNAPERMAENIEHVIRARKMAELDPAEAGQGEDDE